MGAQWLLCPCRAMAQMLILSCLLSVGLGLPLESLVNQGPQLGPLTPAHGDLVQTPRGLASIHLEGFSEDLNEDGYVDPVAQAAPVGGSCTRSSLRSVCSVPTCSCLCRCCGCSCLHR